MLNQRGMDPKWWGSMLLLLVLTLLFPTLEAINYQYNSAPYGDNKWYLGTATMYTFNGNSGFCGFPWSFVYDYDYAAVRIPRYSDSKTPGVPAFSGAACGQCYKLRCYRKGIKGSKVFCRGNSEIIVRINDLDATKVNPWPPNNFDMGRSGFSKLADPAAGAIQVQFKRVACPTKTAKWTRYPKSNPYYHDLGAFDVPEVGSVIEFYIMPTGEKKWYKCKHDWGSHYKLDGLHTVNAQSKVKIILAETRKVIYPKFQQFR